MTVTGLVTALGIGLAIGVLGQVAFPDRRDLPVWLPLTVGAVTALLGSILVRLAGIGADGSVLLRLAAQVGTAVVGVGLVLGTAARPCPTRSAGRGPGAGQAAARASVPPTPSHASERPAPEADRPPAGPTGGTR